MGQIHSLKAEALPSSMEILVQMMKNHETIPKPCVNLSTSATNPHGKKTSEMKCLGS